MREIKGIEFTAECDGNLIIMPEEIKGKMKGRVRVTLVYEEPEESVKIKGVFLERNEIYER